MPVLIIMFCSVAFLGEDGKLRFLDQDKLTFEQAAMQELLITKKFVEVLTTVKDKNTAADAVKKLQSIGKEARAFWAKGYLEKATAEQIEDFHLKHRSEIASINKLFRAESLRLKNIDGGQAVVQELIAQMYRQLDDRKHQKAPPCRTGRYPADFSSHGRPLQKIDSRNEQAERATPWHGSIRALLVCSQDSMTLQRTPWRM